MKRLNANIRFFRKIFVVLSLLFVSQYFSILSSIVLSQDIPEVNVKVLPSHNQIPGGEEFFLIAECKIPSKTHLTENFLTLSLNDQRGFSPGLLQVTSGEYEHGEVVRRGTAYLKLPILVDSTFPSGEVKLKGTVTYQICSEGEQLLCYPPKDVPFEVAIQIDSPSGKEVINTVGQSFNSFFVDSTQKQNLSDSEKLEKALANKSIFAFFLVFLGGFLTSLTPCIYPMIPITIGYIGGRSAGGKKSKGFILSLFYVTGLALVYSLMGVAAAMTGSLFGSITQTPLVVGGVVAIFVLMGLSMLGFFDLSLPPSLQAKLQGGGPRKGFLGAVLMGAVAGLVAAPCAGPVVIVLLTFIATTGNILQGFLLMLSFAFGLGIIFIVLGTFSGLLSSLPQAGTWMDKVKKVFGILLIGAAVYVAQPLIPPPIFGIIIGVFLTLLGVGIGGCDWFNSESELKSKLLKGIGLLFVVSGLYMVVNLIPIPGKVVPELSLTGENRIVDSEKMLDWYTDAESALSAAKKQNKRIIMDFTAKWCGACKELEHKTFSNKQVAERMKAYILIKVDCTKSRDEKIKSVQEKYNIKGLPTVLIMDKEGEELSRIVSFLPPEQFLTFLDQVEKM